MLSSVGKNRADQKSLLRRLFSSAFERVLHPDSPNELPNLALDRAEYLAHKRRVRAAFVTAAVAFFLVSAWAVIGFAIGMYAVGVLALVTMLNNLCAILLIRKGHHIWGRFFLLFFGNIIFMVFVLLVDPIGKVEFNFMITLVGSFLFFSTRNEVRFLIAFTAMPALCWLVAQYIISLEVFPFVVGYDMAEEYLSSMSILTTLLFVSVQLLYLARTNYAYAEALREAHDEAVQANMTKSNFLANMSHEIRTPMNGVVGMVEVLENEALTAKQRRITETIRNSSNSLLRIVDDILDSAKIEAGKLELEETEVQFHHEIELVASSVQPEAMKNNVEIALYCDPAIPELVICDPVRLKQIITNLLSNAVKFARRPPEDPSGFAQLVVEQEEPGWISITVTDDGIGIDKEILDRIFHPFTQSEEHSKRRFGGTGLGLTIALELTTLMGGSIKVCSEVEKGATFKVMLPLKAVPTEADRTSLQGVTVVGLIEYEFARNRFSNYLTYRGAKFEHASDEKELEELLRKHDPETISLIGFDESSDSKACFHRLAAQFPSLKAVVFSKLQTEDLGLIEKGHYAVAWAPLMPSELVTAVADLAAQNEAENSGPGQSEGPASKREAGKGDETSSAQILVVEDNELNRQVILAQLSMLGYTAEAVFDGVEGLEKWQTGNFDLILSDCHMPRMDGFELTAKIRDHESSNALARTPIIAVTANALSGEDERCIAAGMDDYLAKPVSQAQLDETLKKWMPS